MAISCLESLIRMHAHYLLGPSFIRSAIRVSSVPDTIQHSTTSFSYISEATEDVHTSEMTPSKHNPSST